MKLPSVPAACPVCGGTTFRLSYQADVDVTVTDGKVVDTTCGPQGDMEDYLNSFACATPDCEVRVTSTGNGLSDAEFDEFDEFSLPGEDDSGTIEALRIGLVVAARPCVDLVRSLVFVVDETATAAAASAFDAD